MNQVDNKNIARPTIMLFAISIFTAILNVAYNFIMSRKLSVEEFGELRTLLSVFLMIAVPTSAIQTVVVRYTAYFNAKDEYGKLKYFCLKTIKLLLLTAVVVVISSFIFSPFIAQYLKINYNSSVIITGVLLAFSLITPLYLGLMQGFEKFGHFGLNLFIGAVLRLIIGILLVNMGMKVVGAIGASVIAIVFTIGLAFIPLKEFLIKKVKLDFDIDYVRLYKYSYGTLIILFCFSLISYIDIIIVKHLFSQTDAGYYSCASVIGKAFMFIPMPIVAIIFPKVTSAYARGIISINMLYKTLLATFILCVLGIGFSFYGSEYILLLFGDKYYQASPLIKIFGLAMTPFALIYVLINYLFSKHHTAFKYYGILITLIEAAILYTIPKTLNQFITILGFSGAVMFLILFIYTLHFEERSYKIPYRSPKEKCME